MFYVYADGKPLYYPYDEKLVILSPKLTLEMGKAGSLTFDMPPTNPKYNDLKKLTTLITVEYEDTEIFRGRILSEDKNFYNIKTVYCEGNLSYLVDSVQKGERFKGKTHAFFKRILDNHNKRVDEAKQFTLGNITVEERDIIIAGQADENEEQETTAFDYRQIALNAMTNEWKTTLDYINACLIEYCGGYLRTRRADDKNYLDYVVNYGNTATQEIEFGVNILDITEEVSAEDLFTVLIPLGDDNLDISKANAFTDSTTAAGRTLTHASGSDEIVDETLVERYGRIARTYAFDSVNTVETLVENGKRYLANNANVNITITIKAVDLNLVNPDIQEIYIGDSVHVKSAPHGIGDYLTCSKIEYDFEEPENTVYTFGTPKQTLTDRYKKDKTKKTEDVAGSSGGTGRAAKKEAEEETKSAFREWLNIDPDNPDGKIDLGAMYHSLDDLTESNASIHVTVTDISSELSSQAAFWTKDKDGNVVGSYAEIVLKANEQESEIQLKADKTYVNKLIADEIEAVKGDISWLSSQQINCNGVTASNLKATNGMACGNVTITTGGILIDSKAVSTIDHTHKVSLVAASTEAVELKLVQPA